MAHEFDAYHKWLGIPPAEQPPNHYRLLGVSLFEPDPDVIEAASDQRMAHVRTYQTGAHSARSQTLLNEIAAARLCLLSEARRKDYEDRLRLQLSHGANEPASTVNIVADGPLLASLRSKASGETAKRTRRWLFGVCLCLCTLSAVWIVANGRKADQPRRPGPMRRSAKDAPEAESQPALRKIPRPDPENERTGDPMDDPDRKAAMWVLSVGGSLTVRVGGELRQVATPADLPASFFEVWEVNLSVRNDVDDAGLASLSALRQVRSIDLSSTEIGDAGLLHLQNLGSLEHLGLGATRITDFGFGALSSLSRLRSLGVNFTQVTGSGLSAISGLQELRSLDASAVKLGDEGLTNVVKLSRLESLTLNSGDVTDEQLSMLTRLSHLANLDLMGTSITDAGLRHLARMTQLRRVSLEQTQVTETGITQLQGSLPPSFRRSSGKFPGVSVAVAGDRYPGTQPVRPRPSCQA